MIIKKPSKKASKDQLFAAFDQLHAEYKKLLGGAAPVAQASSSEATSTINDNIHNDGDPMAGQSIEGTISNLVSLRDSFGTAVSALSSRLTAEASRLQEVQNQAGQLAEQLNELYGLEVSDNTLQVVIDEYQNKSVSFQKDLKDKRESFERNISEREASWRLEQEEHSRQVKDRNESLKKAQQRNIEEYGYNLEQTRKNESDAYTQERLKLQRELDATLATTEKQWAEKEKQVSEREALYNHYQTEFEALPAKLEAAIKKAKAEGQGIAGSQAKIKADLIAKENEGERRVFELQIKNLEATIKERAQRLEGLSQQLTQAHKQGQDLAVKAIEGASNATSFGAVREIAMEQAKNLPKK